MREWIFLFNELHILKHFFFNYATKLCIIFFVGKGNQMARQRRNRWTDNKRSAHNASEGAVLRWER